MACDLPLYQLERGEEADTKERICVFFVKHFSLKKASKFLFFIQGNSLLSAGLFYMYFLEKLQVWYYAKKSTC